MSLISLIHPSRARSNKSVQTIYNWLSNSSMPIEVIVALDIDDHLPIYYAAYNDTGLAKKLRVKPQFCLGNHRSAVDAINHAVKDAIGNILIVVSDDTNCPAQWDQALYGIVKDQSDWILKTQDGIQPYIITMPIMDRSYYNRFGYIYQPDYLHMFCDLELTCVADITGRKITSNLMFKHNHYSVTKEQPDAINKKADATWAQGEKLFLERYKRNFDLPKGNPIEDNGMVNWLKQKVR